MTQFRRGTSGRRPNAAHAHCKWVMDGCSKQQKVFIICEWM